MEILTQIVNFFLGLGASVFVPFIMIIAGLIVRMKVKDAISSGITLAVAFTGMNLIISFMKDSLNPAAQAIMSATGMSFPVVDGGWTTMATISWSWPYAFLMFPLLIGINVLMILLNKTNTINADLWNVWLKIFTAVAVASITKSVILAFVVAAVQVVVELKSADANQHRIEKLTGIPGVTCTHTTLTFCAVMYPIACLLKKIPGMDRKFDTETLRNKFGIFAENHVLGFILGCLFGAVARYAFADVLILGVKAATAMTLFPVVAKYFMQALSPISEAMSEFMNKKFEGKELNVGLDYGRMQRNLAYDSLEHSIYAVVLCDFTWKRNSSVCRPDGLIPGSSGISGNTGKSDSDVYSCGNQLSNLFMGGNCICSVYDRACNGYRKCITQCRRIDQ